VSGGRKKPFIVPIFIPNQGCPHRCVFCEQEKITAEQKGHVDGERVVRIIKTAIKSPRFDPALAEIAFYGGTFANLNYRTIEELLGAVSPFLKKGLFTGIRVSTRPDSLDTDKLALMKRRGVKTVELGVQSMNDDVLSQSERGHSAQESEKAVALLKNLGFQVGVQLMPGLPGDSHAIFLSTVEKVVMLQPHMVRLYPALVIKGTALGRMYEKGEYIPLGLPEAVEICAESSRKLEDAGIPVIRIGLMSSPTLLMEGQILAGPWHTAFGFLVRSRMYRKGIASQLPARGHLEKLGVRVRDRDVPLLRGYRNEGIQWISMVTGAEVAGVEGDPSLPPGRVEVIEK